MIIKSMSRKLPTFEQLHAYIREGSRGIEEDFFGRNLNVSDLTDVTHVTNRFDQNYDVLRKKSQGNALYHEIISLSNHSEIDRDRQREMLHEIGEFYLQHRGDDLLAFAGVHFETDNVHLHIMISSNRIMETKRHVLSKAQFRQAQIKTEKMVQERFPELNEPSLYQHKQRVKSKAMAEQEYQLIKRTKQPSKKQVLTEKLSLIFRESYSMEDMMDRLKVEGIELYKRGKSVSVNVKGVRYRLKKLGLEAEYSKTVNGLERCELRRQEIEKMALNRSQRDRNVERKR